MLKEPHALIWDSRLGEDDQEFVAKINSAVRNLSVLRAIEITVSGPFARSKIAWKLAIYQQVLLHRIVALVDGAAATWNCRCTLSSILSARAFMETLAVFAEVKEGVSQALTAQDLGAMDAIAQKGVFATRDEEFLKESPDSRATSVLTYIQKFDKRASGFAAHYDRLSERCHPNALGHNFMFARLDRSDGTVQFMDERNADQNGHLIIAALAMLPLVEPLMSELNNLILKVADLHDRLVPVGGQAR